MLEYLKMLKDLSAQLKAYDAPGKLDQVSDFLTQAAKATHDLAATLRKYVGPQTVGSIPDATPDDLDLWEQELSIVRRDASMCSVGPELITLAPYIIQLAELGLQVIQEIRKRRQAPAPAPAPAPTPAN